MAFPNTTDNNESLAGMIFIGSCALLARIDDLGRRHICFGVRRKGSVP